MDNSKFRRTKFACYTAYFTMLSNFCLLPLLFVTFHELYNVSWTLRTLVLGTILMLVIIRFFKAQKNEQTV